MNLFAMNFVVGIISLGVGVGVIASGDILGIIALLFSSGSWYVVANEIHSLLLPIKKEFG